MGVAAVGAAACRPTLGGADATALAFASAGATEAGVAACGWATGGRGGALGLDAGLGGTEGDAVRALSEGAGADDRGGAEREGSMISLADLLTTRR